MRQYTELDKKGRETMRVTEYGMSKLLVDLKGIIAIRKGGDVEFPSYDIIISREFIENILKEFKYKKIPGDKITIRVAVKLKNG